MINPQNHPRTNSPLQRVNSLTELKEYPPILESPITRVLDRTLTHYGKRANTVGSFEAYTLKPNITNFLFQPLYPVPLIESGFYEWIKTNYRYSTPIFYEDGSVKFQMPISKEPKIIIGLMSYIYAKLLALRVLEEEALDRLDMIANSQGEGGKLGLVHLDSKLPLQKTEIF